MNKDANEFNKSDQKENGEKKKIVSSTKRDANKALNYWTPDKMAEAKPIPLPRKDPKEN